MLTGSASFSNRISGSLVAGIEDVVRGLRVGDPFRPVHVLVPNHVLGGLLSCALFRETDCFGICCELPHAFAWRIAATECLVDWLLSVPEESDLAIDLAAEAQAVDAEGTLKYPRHALAHAGLRAGSAPSSARRASGDCRSRGARTVWSAGTRFGLGVFAGAARAQQAAVEGAGLLHREVLNERAVASL